uniref:CCHC-type domain-containing protein n=1 Tax=Elaeophora elaphi TaxID=1147741 RepID=A0A0R3S731_9BILA
MNKKTFETAKNLHLNWYIYAIKALLGQVGKQMYRQLTEDKQRMLASCLDEIEDDRDLIAGAKCLVQVRHKAYFNSCEQDAEHSCDRATDQSVDTPAFITVSDSEEGKSFKSYDERKNVKRYRRRTNRREKTHASRSGFDNESPKGHPPEASTQNILDLNNTKNFILHNLTTYKHLTYSVLVSNSSNQQKPMMFSKVHLNSLLSINKKSGYVNLMPSKHSIGQNEISQPLLLAQNEIRENRNVAEQSSNSSHHEKIGEMEWKREDLKKQKLVENTNLPMRSRNFRKSDWYFSVPSSFSSEQSGKLYFNPILSKHRKTKLWRRRRRSYRLITNSVIKSDHLIIDVKQAKKMPAMHDSTVKKTPTQQISKFISVMLSGKETNGSWIKTYEDITEFKKQMDQVDSSNAKVYNFRLFDLVLDNEKRTKPKVQLLEKSGMTEKDRQAVLEMVMDISGARAAIEMALDILNETSASNLEGVIFETTKRINQAFKDLEKSFDVEQQNDLKRRGFTFLEASQFKQILHQHGVKELKDVNFDLNKYEQLSRKEKEETLWAHIKRIAENETEELHRKKRQVIPASAPIILAPFMFSPAFGPSILGPVVLSPSIFSPLILNPSILSPFVLSPGIFLPFLISPYILSPYVLSPLVGAPYILSPYVLSPNIINPYVLSPLVLSPYILSPDIISPQLLGGQILSPNALSPAVYTNSFLSVSVLSPSWMSK